MVRSQRIRTPLSHRWQRFRYQVVPYLAFACILVVVALLWREQGRLPNATGIIEAVRIDVATATDGILVGLESSITRPWSLFDRVEAGQVIARLDDASLIAATKTLESESARIRKKSSPSMRRFPLEMPSESTTVRARQTAWHGKSSGIGSTFSIARCRSTSTKSISSVAKK